METEIIVALIGFAGTVIAAAIGVIQTKKYKQQARTYAENSFVRFLQPDETFKDLLCRVKSICLYTVNSHELINKLNTILEQNPDIKIKKVTILVRKKEQEGTEEINILERNISMWENWKEKGRIRNLVIISYDHDPDHYYTILGERLVFCGQVLYDDHKPTGTTVDYLPLVFTDENKLGQQVIKNYQKHFDSVVNKYKNTSTLYPED